MAVRWLAEIDADDVDIVGGKGASLGELTGAGLPVPPGFVVTAGTFRSFIEAAGIDAELFDALEVDVDDSSALAAAADRAQELVLETPFPDDLREELLEAYGTLDEESGSEAVGEDDGPFVAVRSSATAEDLPDASFAGQQETFLNVTGEDLLERVRQCWASLYTQRAIYYRQKQGFDHEDVNIAVVVQLMVDAEKSGVMFTSHPSTGEPTTIIEAAWGLGEAVVSGAVSPDNYEIDRADRTVEATVAEKRVMHVRDDSGETVELDVPERYRTERVLSDDELDALVDLGEGVEAHYGAPQDVEWAMVDGDIYVLQSRPITTISDAPGTPDGSLEGDVTDRLSQSVADGSGNVEAVAGEGAAAEPGSEEPLVTGLGSSPGTATGPVRIVTKLDELDKVAEGDVIVTEMTTPDMVPAMQRAAGIVTDQGGMTSHAAIVSRELGLPAVVGTRTATGALEDGQVVTIDGDRGTITDGEAADPEVEEREPIEEVRPQAPVKPMTATEVKVNVSIPEAAERAAATGADGVGLLRLEHMILSLGKTPEAFVAERGRDAYVNELVDGIRTVADEFYPRPVRVRTLDAPTDEFRDVEGGEDEPVENNPMLGYRGIRRSLDTPEAFGYELEAFRKLYDMGYDNVEVMFPLVTDAEDVHRAKRHLREAGVDPAKRRWGAMIETPAAALSAAGLAETGLDFVSFGTNDLTQYTLAVDRNNEAVADRFDELHPAVLQLIGDVIETCREAGVDTSICGQAGSKPEMIRFLVEAGVSSISANVDAVRDVQHEVKRVEQKLVLDSVR